MSDPSLPVSSTTDFYRPVEVFVVHPPKQRYWIHLLLLLITFYTTLVVGARMEFNFLHHLPSFYTGDDSLSIFPGIWALQAGHLMLGVPFAFTLMLILLAHEMGHYLFCRRYFVWATLPFFIPFPTLIGTLGAFIRIRSPIRSRSHLFDIGIAGPIAGFVVAVAVLFFSLGLSQPAQPGFDSSSIQVGLPLVFHLVHRLLISAGMARGVATLPLAQVNLHPVAVAAWVGMFATALNLLPGGQLDGGHIIYSLFPRAHRVVSMLAVAVLIPLAYFKWDGWLVWAIFLGISGMRHPMVPPWPGVDGSRRWLAVFALVMLILTWTPTPILHNSLPEVIHAFRTGQ